MYVLTWHFVSRSMVCFGPQWRTSPATSHLPRCVLSEPFYFQPNPCSFITSTSYLKLKIAISYLCALDSCTQLDPFLWWSSNQSLVHGSNARSRGKPRREGSNLVCITIHIIYSIEPCFSKLPDKMKYYKPLFYSAATIIYASFAFRVLRIGLLSRMIKQKRDTRTS